MLLAHAHQPERFDPGRCRDCARDSDLPDHYRLPDAPVGVPSGRGHSFHPGSTFGDAPDPWLALEGVSRIGCWFELRAVAGRRIAAGG
jgi:hypothetical protein